MVGSRDKERAKREAEATRLGAIARDKSREEMRKWAMEYLKELALKSNMDILAKCGMFDELVREDVERLIANARALNREPRNKKDILRARKLRQDLYNNEHMKPFSRRMSEQDVKCLVEILREYDTEPVESTSIGIVPVEIYGSWTPEAHKIIKKFKEDNPEWSGWDNWERKRLEVQRADREEAKRKAAEEEDSPEKRKLIYEAEEVRTKKLELLLKDAEDIYKRAKTAEDKEEAAARCGNIKAALEESKKLAKKYKKEMK